MNKQLQLKYILKTYDKQGQETFRQPFYLDSSVSYRTVLLQMIDYLRGYNLEIKPENLKLIIGTSDNPSELYVTLESEKRKDN